MTSQGSTKFRPRKKSLVSSILPFTRRCSAGHHDVNGRGHNSSGSVGSASEPAPSSDDTKSNIAILITLVIVIVYFFSGQFRHTTRYIPIKGGVGNIVETEDLIIVPSLSNIPYMAGSNAKANSPPNRAPNDNVKPIKDLGMPPPAAKKSSAGSLLSQSVPIISPIYTGQESPAVVLVVGLDYEKFGPDYLEKIVENRKHYAKAHGYGIYSRFVQEFKSEYIESFSGDSTWAKVALCRAALLAFPQAKYFWYLDETALIMNPLVDLWDTLLDPKVLDDLMIRDVPVVSNSDIIRTYKYTKPEHIQFIISQDDQGFNPVSFIFKNSDYSISLMEYWNDPRHREYEGFDRSDASALNHLAVWHQAMLSKMAVVPAKKMASLSASSNPQRAYTDGDFVAVFECDTDTKPCMDDFSRFWNGQDQLKS